MLCVTAVPHAQVQQGLGQGLLRYSYFGCQRTGWKVLLVRMAFLQTQSPVLQPNCPIAPVFSQLPLSFCCFSLSLYHLPVPGKAVPMPQLQLWLAQDGSASGSGDFLVWRDEIGVGCGGKRADGQWRALLMLALCSLSFRVQILCTSIAGGISWDVNLQAELSLLTGHLHVHVCMHLHLHVHLCMQMLPCALGAGSHKDPLLLPGSLCFCYGGDANTLLVLCVGKHSIPGGVGYVGCSCPSSALATIADKLFTAEKLLFGGFTIS